jgi:hypothetical protein
MLKFVDRDQDYPHRQPALTRAEDFLELPIAMQFRMPDPVGADSQCGVP